MSKIFTEIERGILNQVAIEVEEFHVDERRGVSQNKYVFRVEGDAVYVDFKDGLTLIGEFEKPVPEELTGHWMMCCADDLKYSTLQECIRTYDWVKCRSVEVKSMEWEEIT